MVARVFSHATAFNARRFLAAVVEALPVALDYLAPNEYLVPRDAALAPMP